VDNFKDELSEDSEFSIYSPECAVYTPHKIEEWKAGIEFQIEDNDKHSRSFLTLMPYFLYGKKKELPGPPEFWLRNLISHSFFMGLGIAILRREYSRQILHGLEEGWSREILFWLSEIKKIQQTDNYLWIHSVNVLTVRAGTAWPGTIGPDVCSELVKKAAPIAGLTPGLRLGLEDSGFAKRLFDGALDEREKCDSDRLLYKIDRMEAFMRHSFHQEDISENN